MTNARKRPPNVEHFLVLLVEDGKRDRGDMRESLEEIEGVYVVEATDRAMALGMIDRYHVDAAVVDLKLAGIEGAGLDVIDELEARVPSAPVVISTNHARRSKALFKYIGSEQVIRIHGKSEESASRVAEFIRPVVERWQRRRVTIVNGRLVRDLLLDRKGRDAYDLRKTKRELERELERIYRHLFGDVRGLEENADVIVTFRLIEREGLSAAITVEGEVTLGQDAATKEPVRGNRCVVKIGPIGEIEEEVERYDRFVKFGVRMAQRVELLNFARVGSLGGIAYSFAGGVFGHSLMSFDELLRRPDGRNLVSTAIKHLFNPDGKNWYGVRCSEVSPLDYMQDTYETTFEECFESLDKSLEGLQQKFSRGGISHSSADEDKPGSFLFRGGRLTIPPTNVCGTKTVYPRRPACLVHGDMHGGNVMVELGYADGRGRTEEAELDDLAGAELRRICLIDYGNAGPGPRAVDAVALQASIRLVDAALIAEDVAPGVPDRELQGKALEKAVRRAANRVQAETTWLERAWDAEPDGVSEASNRSAPWAAASALLTARMRSTFKDMRLEEYLSIAIPCGIRQFGYAVGPLARVRLLAWVSALYTVANRGDHD